MTSAGDLTQLAVRRIFTGRWTRCRGMGAGLMLGEGPPRDYGQPTGSVSVSFLRWALGSDFPW